MKARASRGQLEILNSERTEEEQCSAGGGSLCSVGFGSLLLDAVMATAAARSIARGNGKVVATNEVERERERDECGPTERGAHCKHQTRGLFLVSRWWPSGGRSQKSFYPVRRPLTIYQEQPNGLMLSQLTTSSSECSGGPTRLID